MSQPNNHLYEFEQYQLNTRQRQLLRNGQRVKLNPKAFELLALLVQNHGRVVTKKEILEQVWSDVLAADARIFAQIKKIRWTLGKRGKGKQKEGYIETIPGDGYQFVAPVKVVLLTEDDPGQQSEKKETDPPFISAQSLPSDPVPVSRRRSKRKTILGSVIMGLALVAALWWYKKSVEAEIRHVVQDSQIVETLRIYTNPEGFDKTLLNKYWLPEEQGGVEITKVKATIDKLLCEEARYGTDAKLEQFNFRYVKVALFGFGKSAIVETEESWYLPKYKKDGSVVPQEAKNLYMKTAPKYELRKVGGAWLIVHSGVPRRRSLPCPSPTPTPHQ